MKKFLSFVLVAGLMAFAYFKFVPEGEQFDFKKLFGSAKDSTLNIIIANAAEIHEKSNLEGNVVATVHIGDTVEIRGVSTDFHQVETKQGLKGWISDEFLGVNVIPAAFMMETEILDKPERGAQIDKSYLCGDFVVAVKTVGDFVEVKGQGREQLTYGQRGIMTGYVPASVLTYDPLDLRFAVLNQRMLDEKDEAKQEEMRSILNDPEIFEPSQLWIAYHSHSTDEAEDEGDAEGEGLEKEDPGFGIMQMQLNPPTDGLVAHYEMDHIAVEDNTDFKHNGQSFNVSFDHDKNGSAMAAWLFNGKDSYVTIDQWSYDKLEPPFTIVAYVKLADIATKMGTIASRGRSADGTGFNFGYAVKDNGSLVLYFVMIGAQGPINVDVQTNIPAGEWVFLAVSYDTKEMKLYVNGELAGSNVVSREDESAILYNFEESNEPFEIGRELKSLDRYFNGSIDNLAVWNRALSDEEIAGMNH